jgi:hypothetical protein
LIFHRFFFLLDLVNQNLGKKGLAGKLSGAFVFGRVFRLTDLRTKRTDHMEHACVKGDVRLCVTMSARLGSILTTKRGDQYESRTEDDSGEVDHSILDDFQVSDRCVGVFVIFRLLGTGFHQEIDDRKAVIEEWDL